MLYVSRETPEATAKRLASVLARSTVTWFPEPYRFEELPSGSQRGIDDPAVAWLRNGTTCSRLVRTNPHAVDQPYGLIQIRFPEGVDNSGFVGWFVSHLKRALGIGVFIICGYDQKEGGIYDDTGFPWNVAESVRRELEALRELGQPAGDTSS